VVFILSMSETEILTYFKTTGEGKIPTKGNATDAGYDIFASDNPKIVGETITHDGKTYYKSIDYIQYPTGLFLQPFENKQLVKFDVRPRSSISGKTWLTMCNTPATIDHGYRGEIFIRFRYNFQPSDFKIIITAEGETHYCVDINEEKIYKKGQAIGQMLPSYVNEFVFMKKDKLDESDRGEGGFGSTGN
jgi:dUTPase